MMDEKAWKALEAARNFCEAVQGQAPPPFNKTPLALIEEALAPRVSQGAVSEIGKGDSDGSQ